MDRASLLRPDTQRALEQELAAFEAKTGHQIVVHVTPSLDGLPIEDYSMQIAEAWRIGQKGLDNGVILTIAPNERELRIEVGYGLEGVLPDAIAARIRDQILASFREGRIDEGVVAGVGALMSVTQGEALPLPARKREAPPWFVTVLLVLLFLTLPYWLRAMAIANRGAGWGTSYRAPYGRSGWGGGFRGGGGFGGGGFGGGGFSGGGGGFGGGGASGRW
jgi:uncharacterized protein